ncbi:SiaB family protein kinase [Eisenibacter elegans]|jgi:hypothetical protein|uniref:SiaB family protein kinase n=1 Tax=Eisenibacter elegans TaxID=997 RepID=UPI00041AC62C|nr:SiaB family protein kinase [Eisenibacter elegans]
MERKAEFNFFEYHSQISQDNVMLSYKGPLTDVLLSQFIRDIRDKLQDDPRVGKKVFAVFMELAQNVLYYSKEVNHFGERNKVGTLVIVNEEDRYRVVTGNLIYKKDVSSLVEKCQVINSLDRESLREYKRKLRNAPTESESKGAGIGLVQAALTSDNPLEFQVRELENEYAFYVLFVNIEKL